MKSMALMIKSQTLIALRNKQILLCYYIIPIVFFLVFGFVLVGLNPNAKDNIPASMIVFSLSMGAFLGLSASVFEAVGAEQFKSLKVLNIRVWKLVLAEQISCFVHMIIMAAIIAGLSVLVFDSSLSNIHSAAAVVSLIEYLIFAIIVATVVGLFSSARNILMVVSQLVFFITILLGGVMFPTSFLPEFLSQISTYLPSDLALSVCNNHSNEDLLPLSIITVVLVVGYVFLYRLAMHRKSKQE